MRQIARHWLGSAGACRGTLPEDELLIMNVGATTPKRSAGNETAILAGETRRKTKLQNYILEGTSGILSRGPKSGKTNEYAQIGEERTGSFGDGTGLHGEERIVWRGGRRVGDKGS